MRVVAGIAKGRRLAAPKGDTTRPTSDFVREAIFNAIGSQTDLEGASVADLFAGSGAMGIEALSRGAASADLVEVDRVAVTTIRQNLESTGLAGGAVHQSDVVKWLQRQAIGGGFDVVFADPPYAFDGWRALLDAIATHLAGDERARLVVIESDRELDLGEGWEVLRSKRYGTTVVTLTSPNPRSHT